MNLSIFNFDAVETGTSRHGPFAAIGRALIVCLLLLVAYQGLIASGRVPASDGIGQSENNLIRAQNYAAGLAGTPELALVGTSLTVNLRAEYFGSHVVNLGLSGGSVRTGLALVLRASHKPQTLLVEVDDKISLPIDEKLLDGATGPKASVAARSLPVLREEYRPVGVLVSGLKRWIKRRHSGDDTDRDTVPVPPAVRHQLIDQTLSQYADPLNAVQQRRLQSAAYDVQGDLRILSQDGVRVVLFDPPGEPAVQLSVQQRQTRTLLHGFFPEGRYRWLPAPPPQPWTTSDGIHLIRADAHRYADFVLAQLRDETPPAPI